MAYTCRVGRRHAWATAALAFLIYLATLQPSVVGGDAGELMDAALTGGVAHPPGYPLYTLLLRLFAALPGLDVGVRMNLLSALLGALACGLLAEAVTTVSRAPWAGVLAGGMFALSHRVWPHATSAEVFALNNMLTAALLALAARYAEHASFRTVALTAFCAGLALANHHTSIFVVIPVLGWMGRAFPRALLLLPLGLIPYVYLPLAARSAAAVTWGDPSTLTGLVEHVLRREYGTFQLVSAPLGEAETLRALGFFLTDTVRGVLGVGVVFAVLAMRQRRTWCRVVAGALLIDVLVFHSLVNMPLEPALLRGVQARFYQLPLLLLLALAGVGFARLRRGSAPVAVALVVIQGALNLGDVLRHRGRVVEEYGRSILRAAPPDAIVLTRGDLITNSVRYLQAAEGLRGDVRVVDQEILSRTWMRYAAQFPDVTFPGTHYHPREPGGFTMAQFVAANLPRHPIVVCGGFKEGDSSVPGLLQQWPLGICKRLHPPDVSVDFHAWLVESEQALPPVPSGPFSDESWEQVVLQDALEARHARGFLVLTHPSLPVDTATRNTLAVRLLEEAAQDPRAAPHVHKNLGIALSRLGTPEAHERMKAEFRRYLQRAPAQDPEIPAIKRAMGDL
ncbi:MAG: DUF2723 domain-containing protein [Myxococcota bacterium]